MRAEPPSEFNRKGEAADSAGPDCPEANRSRRREEADGAALRVFRLLTSAATPYRSFVRIWNLKLGQWDDAKRYLPRHNWFLEGDSQALYQGHRVLLL